MYFVGSLNQKSIFVSGAWRSIENGGLIEANHAFSSKDAAYRDYCFKNRWHGLIPAPKNEITFIKVKGVNAYKLVKDFI